MSDEAPLVRVALEEEGALLHVTLNRPKANILDRGMVAALHDALNTHGNRLGLKTILFDAAGEHFSFGASVEQHRPAEVAHLLGDFHHLFHELAVSGKVCLAAVRGLCLGGGLELAAFCHRVFAAPGAKLGNPEIKLGVFAPLASVVLPFRVGQPAADDLLLTGRTVEAPEALALRLGDEIVEDPTAAALAWHHTHLAPLSAAALEHAVGAARLALYRAIDQDLPLLEHHYLEDLMATTDAREGIEAFLARRTPQWTHQ